MLKFAIAFVALLIVTEARSQGRSVSTAITCSRAAGLVSLQGAVVLGTGVYTYDRYVSGPSFCLLSETTEPAWIPTVDNPQCFVGYQCRQQVLRQGGR
jgi:hypothetical protein